MRNDKSVLVRVDGFLDINKWLEPVVGTTPWGRGCVGGSGTERDLRLERTVDSSSSERQISRQVKTIFKYSKNMRRRSRRRKIYVMHL